MISPTPDQLAREAEAKHRNRVFAAALLAGQSPEEARAKVVAASLTRPHSQPEPVAAPPVVADELPKTHAEALKVLGLHGRHIRMRPVLTGYRPQRQLMPVAFPYQDGQQLTKLSRKVSRAWRALFTSVSTTSLAGGRLNGSQGRNAVAIIEHLRQKTYLKTDATGRPVQVREQTVEVVDGAQFSLAKELGMSPATFYRALQHPLMHFFLRTQKVQRIEEGTNARRNVATLFSVSVYEPALPDDVETACYAEALDLGVILLVSDSNSQDERAKGQPLESQKQKNSCGKLTEHLQGLSCGTGRGVVLEWIDQAALITRAAEQKHRTPLDQLENSLKGCIDNCRETNPELWELAAHIAIYHDDPQQQAVAAVGYYKALIHLGTAKVRMWVKRLEKWRRKGQNITTPGRLLMHLLNKEARAATGYPISDLGTRRGELAT